MERKRRVQGRSRSPHPQLRTKTESPEKLLREFEELLQSLKQTLKLGTFQECRAIADHLMKVLKRHESFIKKRLEEDYYRALCLVAETYDYLGRWTEARQACNQGPSLLSEIINMGRNETRRRRTLVREQVRLCLIYAHTHLYRTQQPDQAAGQISTCLDFVEKNLMTGETDSEPFPCWGTRAQASIYLARAKQQLNEFDAAEDLFRQAMQYMEKRVHWKKQQDGAPEGIEEDVQFAIYRSAICLGLGIAWVNHKRGFLKRARHYVQLAQLLFAFLKEPPDPLNKTALDLILASIDRSMAGSDGERLDEIISRINGSRRAFDLLGHEYYLSWAEWELGLAYVQKKDIQQAHEVLIRLEKRATRPKDLRSACNCKLLRCHIEQDFDKRVELSTHTIKFAEENDQPLSRLEALLLRADAQIRRKQPQLANAKADLRRILDDLTSGGTSAASNPRIAATCYLYLAEIDTKEEDVLGALRNFREAQDLLRRVEDRCVIDLKERVQTIIGDLPGDFSISATEGCLKHKCYESRLQEWLFKRARERARDDDKKLAELLEISPPTARAWKKKYGGSS